MVSLMTESKEQILFNVQTKVSRSAPPIALKVGSLLEILSVRTTFELGVGYSIELNYALHSNARKPTLILSIMATFINAFAITSGAQIPTRFDGSFCLYKARRTTGSMEERLSTNI